MSRAARRPAILTGATLATTAILAVAAPRGWALFPRRTPSVAGDRRIPLDGARRPGAVLDDEEADGPGDTAEDLAAPARAPEREPRQRGVALTLAAEDVSFSYEPLVEQIAELGAKDLELVVPLYQTDGRSDDLRWDTRRSPTLSQVAETIRQAHRRRLAVTVTPLVQLAHPAPGEWRGNLRPSRRALWFRHYTDLLGDLAGIAGATQAERLVVGTELSTLDGADDRAAWEALLERVRGLFAGRLVYAAAAEHYREARVLDWVDEAGVTGFFALRRASEPPTAATLEASWRRVRAELEAWSETRQKPFVFTAIAYRSCAGATITPRDEMPCAKPDPEEQALAYRAFRRTWEEVPSLLGFYVGDWYGYGGPRSASTTPKGKPAEAELRALLTLP